MAKGLGILLAIGAGVGFLAMASDAKASSGGSGGGPNPTPLNEDCYDSHAPPELRQRVYAILQSKDLSPKDLEAASAANAAAGFPKIAACLHQKAVNKQAELQTTIAQRGGLPHVIRYGDIPSIMAQYYTGQPQRFKEFAPLNPHIGQLTTQEWPAGSGKMVSNYPGWTPGTEILIPAAWDPLSKPIPPVASGGLGNKAAGSTAQQSTPQGSGSVGTGVQTIFDMFKIPGNMPGQSPGQGAPQGGLTPAEQAKAEQILKGQQNGDTGGILKGDWPFGV